MQSPITSNYLGAPSTTMPDDHPVRTTDYNNNDNKYVVTSKIMLVALAVLFTVVVFIICLHIYARWFWATRAGHQDGSLATIWFWRRRRSGQNSSFNNPAVVDANGIAIDMVMGLDKSTIEALPTFRYKLVDNTARSTEIGPDCAVCLEEFKEDEVGRTLPKCGHSFHLECIDMWLSSNSTCPLCRANLQTDQNDLKSVESGSLSAAIATEQESISESMGNSRRFQVVVLDQNIELRPQDDEMDEHARETLHAVSQFAQVSQAQNQDTLPQPADSSPLGEAKAMAKRMDSIPANVLFWGHHTQWGSVQQSGGQPMFSAADNDSPQVQFQVAIDIDVARYQHHLEHALSFDTSCSSPSSPYVSNFNNSHIIRTSASFRRLLSRGKVVPSATEDVDETEIGASSS